MTTAFYHQPNHQAHEKPGHVERPERLQAVLELLREDPLWDEVRHLDALPVGEEEMTLAHTADYVQRLQNAVEAGGAQLDVDTYATAFSLVVSAAATGGLLALCRAVVEGAADNGFAATRPPGHHATPDQAMGFCLLNHVAIAARWLRREYGLERVLIVDFDVHHGNGTQDIFYDDPDVLYASLHQAPLYPGTGIVEETGTGRGRGATVNVPLPARTGDAAYLDGFRQILAPLAWRFRPEMILLSAGYDAHWRDPLGGMHLSVAGLADLVRETMAWADAWCAGRLVALLEGGYDAEALAHGVRGSLQVLRDPTAEIEDALGPAPGADADVQNYLREVAAFHGL